MKQISGFLKIRLAVKYKIDKKIAMIISANPLATIDISCNPTSRFAFLFKSPIVDTALY